MKKAVVFSGFLAELDFPVTPSRRSKVDLLHNKIRITFLIHFYVQKDNRFPKMNFDMLGQTRKRQGRPCQGYACKALKILLLHLYCQVPVQQSGRKQS